jgi:hypothetical protein
MFWENRRWRMPGDWQLPPRLAGISMRLTYSGCSTGSGSRLPGRRPGKMTWPSRHCSSPRSSPPIRMCCRNRCATSTGSLAAPAVIPTPVPPLTAFPALGGAYALACLCHGHSGRTSGPGRVPARPRRRHAQAGSADRRRRTAGTGRPQAPGSHGGPPRSAMPTVPPSSPTSAPRCRNRESAPGTPHRCGNGGGVPGGGRCCLRR